MSHTLYLSKQCDELEKFYQHMPNLRPKYDYNIPEFVRVLPTLVVYNIVLNGLDEIIQYYEEEYNLLECASTDR